MREQGAAGMNGKTEQEIIVIAFLHPQGVDQ